ncbi:hypothetical protein UF78_13675 [Stutzerimonas stutzeri]|jgi:hypothetical protein|uniref:Uncharacterized protein n=1 Tax=Stutzerimonas stutzeri TaxID=316 RepID=A0A0D9ANQ1_STUST|nr:hypothetical protein UF78_13675 [Stutzerimonas stutzeri]
MVILSAQVGVRLRGLGEFRGSRGTFQVTTEEVVDQQDRDDATMTAIEHASSIASTQPRSTPVDDFAGLRQRYGRYKLRPSFGTPRLAL